MCCLNPFLNYIIFTILTGSPVNEKNIEFASKYLDSSTSFNLHRVRIFTVPL